MLASETLNLDPAKFAKREACRKFCIGHGLVFTSTRGGKVKDDIVKGSGSTVLGAALFVFNGGTAPEAAAEETKSPLGWSDCAIEIH